jgi:protein-disulfide isomerase
MNTSPKSFAIKPQFQIWVAGLLLVCLTSTGCSSLAQQSGGNAPTVSPDLEAQVLQIIRQNPEVILESVETYRTQQQDATRKARQDFLKQLMEEPAKVIGDSPTTGSPQKKIVLIEFSDFQCPYCAKAHETVKAFMGKHRAEVTLVYKHLPLTSIHPEAMPAAKAAWAAGVQGKFWEYHAALFEKQEKLGNETYESIAKTLNLDVTKFNSDRASDAAQAAIDKDLELTKQLGLTGTPVFFLNQEVLTGAVELAELESALERVTQEPQ